MTTPPRHCVAVVLSHPIQYYVPLYRCLAQRGAIDLKVIYLTDAGAKSHTDPGFGRTVQWDVPLLEGYEYKVLQPDTEITARGFWSTYDSGLTTALERARPDWLLLYGYASRMNWVAVHWARQHRVRIAYASDSNSLNPERLVPIKKRLVGHFFQRVDAFLSPSERNVEYLLRYSAAPHRVYRIPFAIDVPRFTPSNSPDAPRTYDFVWVGKFIPLKRAGDFIAALAAIAGRFTRPIRACIAGDGPCRAALMADASQLPSRCVVDFAGFVNQQNMPALLQSAQVLAFTSERDAYGLACTEAAAAGLALVVADNNGCVGDTVLARTGVNALTYRAGDVSALADAMAQLLCDGELRTRMQRASLAIAQQHDIICEAKAIEELVSEVTDRDEKMSMTAPQASARRDQLAPHGMRLRN